MPKKVKKILALVITLSMLCAAMPTIAVADGISNSGEILSSVSSETKSTQENTEAEDETASKANAEASTEANSERKGTDTNSENTTSEGEEGEVSIIETIREAMSREATNGEGMFAALRGFGASLLGVREMRPMGGPGAPGPSGGSVIKAKLTSGNNTVELATAGANMEVAAKSDFTLNISATFPPGTNKKVEIKLPYGMSWASSKGEAWSKIDKTQSWYANELEKMILPKDQTDNADKSATYETYNLDDGKLTFMFKDSTEAVNFDLNLATLMNRASAPLNPQLKSIAEAVKVDLAFLPEGGSSEDVKTVKLDELKIKPLPELNAIGTVDYKEFAKDGKIIVPVGGDTGYLINWYAGLSNSSYLNRHLTTDYYVRMLAPAGAQYKGIYNKDADTLFGRNFSQPEVQESGTYVDAKGVTKTIPAGYTLYTFRTDAPTTTAYTATDLRWVFNPMWSFADTDKFPVGKECEISVVDIGVKFYNPKKAKEYCDYETYDESKLAKTKVIYKVEEPKERVYVQAKYKATYNAANSQWEIVDQGYVADHTLDLGNPGFEHTQEWLAGYFIIGNRGTKDSVAKRVTLEYDVNKTGFIGITGQMLPANYGVRNVVDSEITGLQYKLWNRKTNEYSDWLDYAGEVPPTGIKGGNDNSKSPLFVISDVTTDKDVYFAGIRYQINTVPKQSVLGLDGYAVDNTFPYFGCVLTNDAHNVKPNPAPAGDGTEFLSTISIEDADEDAALEENKRLGRSFTGTSGIINMEGVHIEWGTPSNKYSVPIGDYKNSIKASMTGSGSSGWAGTVDKMWLISPNGEEIENLKVIVEDIGDRLMSDGVSRYGWNRYDATSKVKIREVEDESVLQAIKASGKYFSDVMVWEIDFTGITDPEDFFKYRVTGPLARTYKTANANRPMSYAGYWWKVGGIYLEYDQKSLYTDPLRKESGPLLWAKLKDTTTEKNSNGDTVPIVYPTQYMSPDIYNLSGNGNDQTLFYNTTLTVTPKDSLSVVAGLKGEKNTLYRTYDLNDPNTILNLKKTVNANLPVNYKVNLVNNSGSLIDKADVFFPVPKKGEYWGTAINPKGAFKFNMELTPNSIKNIPEGYTIYYATATPDGNYLKWGDAFIQWKTANMITDWSAVNFVKITKNAPMANAANDEFVFDMVASPDAELNEINAWRTTYRAQMSSSAGWAEGDATASSVGAGVIHGTSWHDTNYDGHKDDGEEIVPGTKLKLYAVNAEGRRGRLLDVQVADENGNYEFDSIRDNAVFEIKTYIPSEYREITLEGTIAADSQDNSFSKDSYNTRIDPLTASARRNVGFVKSVHTITYEYTGTIPQNAPKPPGLTRADIDTKVTVADNPTMAGYSFTGWKIKSPAGIAITDNKFKMPDTDVELYGSWVWNPSSDGNPPKKGTSSDNPNNPKPGTNPNNQNPGNNPGTPDPNNPKPDINPGTPDSNNPTPGINPNNPNPNSQVGKIPGLKGNKRPQKGKAGLPGMDIYDEDTPIGELEFAKDYIPKAPINVDNRPALPQTGQNFAIIEILGALGIVLVISGLLMIIRVRRKIDEK